jgi:hypothetical protein
MLIRGSLLAAAALALSGCAISPLTTDHPYPTYGNPVNPTPVPGYRVVCRSAPEIGYPLFHNFTTACRQVIVPGSEQVVVRVRG